MTKNARIRVSGRVQGVGFRAATKRTALALEISGTVQNEADGTVLIVAEGEESKLKEFIAWCHKGPPHAVVSEVQIIEGVVEGLSKFVVGP